jgi:anti-sigma B factor antagonist
LGDSQMEITQKDLDTKTSVVALDGALNAASADDVRDTVRTLIEKGKRQVVLDLEAVPFIDSSGLAALVSCVKALNQEGGSLKLASLQSQAELLFQLTMFDKIFDVFENAEEASRSFS